MVPMAGTSEAGVNATFIQACQDERGMFVTGILCLTDLDLHQIRGCTFGHQGFLTTKPFWDSDSWIRALGEKKEPPPAAAGSGDVSV